MKYLKKYKLFENEEVHEDDVIEKGHKMSWNDIKERMVYLNDLGFELDPESKKQYFVGVEYDEANLSDAHKLVTEMGMVRELPDDDDVVSRKNIYFQKWNDNQLEIFEAIASFCAHFDECYYNYRHEFDKLFVNFIIYQDVDPEVRNKEKEDVITHKVTEGIIESFERAMREVRSQFTKLINKKISTNKVGETMHFLQGSIEDGYIVVPVNLTDFSKQQLKRTLLPKLEMDVDSFERVIGKFGKVEFREIKEEDINKLAHERWSKFGRDKKYFEERYLGLMGYIITFDYKKLFDKRKHEN